MVWIRVGQKDDEFDLWFPLGGLAGAVIVMLVVSACSVSEPSKYIYEYQTLISAAVALFAALQTVRATVQSTQTQIKSALDVAEKRRTERHNAARALLTFGLTELVQYCKASVIELLGMLGNEAMSPHRCFDPIIVISGETFVAQHLPVTVLDRIRDVIETAPPDIAEAISILLIETQVYSSRIQGLQKEIESRRPTPYELRNYILDICQLHARSCRYYDYGRFKSEIVSGNTISQSEMFSSARLLNVDVDNTEFSRMIEEIFPK